MWIFLEGGRFLSLSADPSDPDRVLARARLPGDLETDFPGARITESDDTDYRFSASVTRAQALAAIAHEIEDMAYPSLRRTVCNANRVTAIQTCNQAMIDAQQRALKGQDQVSTCGINPQHDDDLPYK
ncbi:hypothetical protein [Magnetofaba australis]|uniref:Uncharacterized protein n=1 Tax=Magnetofaba australis IT-1 TaxID=1434232 RepID=A0A1Y2K3R7_9PROT|nr:hypothetical protein [Magnetofaba australis]OSM03970.1 hypothetical protein MAIT1_03782 [Magnetofaba australis IT-1]